MAGADYIGGIDATGNPVAPAQDDTGALQVPGDLPVAVAVPGDVGQDKAHRESHMSAWMRMPSCAARLRPAPPCINQRTRLPQISRAPLL